MDGREEEVQKWLVLEDVLGTHEWRKMVIRAEIRGRDEQGSLK